MKKREIIKALLARQLPERVGLNESFWPHIIGNIDVRALESGDRDWIREECLGKLNGMKALRAPYVYMSDHSIPPSVKVSDYEYMLELLIYCYATGRFVSRRIEEATYSDVALRFICAHTHPDHDTICKFRREEPRTRQEDDASPAPACTSTDLFWEHSRETGRPMSDLTNSVAG